jgi:hypothetical protein
LTENVQFLGIMTSTGAGLQQFIHITAKKRVIFMKCDFFSDSAIEVDGVWHLRQPSSYRFLVRKPSIYNPTECVTDPASLQSIHQMPKNTRHQTVPSLNIQPPLY